MSVRACRLGLALLVGTFLAAAGSAQDAAEVVYVTSSAGDKLQVVDFDFGTTVQINTDSNIRKKLQGLYVRNNGSGKIDVIVCDNHADEVVIYEDVNGANAPFDGKAKVIANVTRNDGPWLDLSGNLWVISSPPGSGSSKKRKLMKILKGGGTGGFGAVVTIDGNVPSTALEDTKVVNFSAGNLSSNDVLVLSQSPPQMFRYRLKGFSPCPGGEQQVGSGANTYCRKVFVTFPAGTQPTGTAFSIDQNILVADGRGDILRVSPSGALLSNFFAGLGNGLQDLAVGIQEGANRAIANQRNAPVSYLFGFLGDGTGTILGTVSRGLNFPVGVGLGTGKGVPTRAGTNVQIAGDTVDSTFDDTTQGAGITDLTCRRLPATGSEPRETDCADEECTEKGGTCIETSDGDFCSRDLPLSELDPSLPSTVKLPEYVRCFRVGDPLTGPRQCFICEGQTTASQRRTIRHVEHEDQPNALGYDIACPVANTISDNAPWAAFLRCPTPAEPPLAEAPGTTCIDLSTGCGNSNRAETDDYSFYFPVVQEVPELQTITQIGGRMLSGICSALNQNQGLITGNVSSGVEATLRAKLDAARTAFAKFNQCGNSADKTTALTKLTQFVATIDANPTAFDNSTRNILGELVARANAAKFMISNAPAPAYPPSCCSYNTCTPPTVVPCTP